MLNRNIFTDYDQSTPLPPIERIMLTLQDIGRLATAGSMRRAIERTDRAIAAHPGEPVFYLRRADLLVQKPAVSRVVMRMNLFDESTRMIDKLDELHDSSPIFRLSADREKRYFGYISHCYDQSGWHDLCERTLQTASRYFPNTMQFKQLPERPRPKLINPIPDFLLAR